jgi:hypothetical protein
MGSKLDGSVFFLFFQFVSVKNNCLNKIFTELYFNRQIVVVTSKFRQANCEIKPVVLNYLNLAKPIYVSIRFEHCIDPFDIKTIL